MSRKIFFVFSLLLVMALLVPVASAQEAEETPVQFIELAGPAADRNSEISGLAWYGDTLLLLAEDPFDYANERLAGTFFALDKDDILEYLEADAPEPLTPRPVRIMAPDIQQTVGGYEVSFDGFEAAVFVSSADYFAPDYIYLLIEAEMVSDGTMRSYLVSGTVERGLSGVQLNLRNYVSIPHQTDYNNLSYESMFVADGKLVMLYETNGASPNPDTVAYTFDLETGELLIFPFPNVEFRITDATNPDENGVFWATNYFWAGEPEAFMATDADPLFEAYGMGASQAEFSGYERLVAFQYGEEGITLVDTAPIQLQMTEDSNGRNWEGIARLDDMGFLVVVDKYPATLLGFVPAP